MTNSNSSSSESIKKMVREKYQEIAEQERKQNASSCCGATGYCSGVDYTIFSENYDKLEGYVEGADLGLGCGLPTQFAKIKEGDTVLDLGSGAGNDCFVARAIVKASGKVIGVDMTETMIKKARDNAEQLQFNNVEFRLGEIEKLPVGGERVNVVISNCVLNLVPDKKKAFAEIFRVLKVGGHLSISDVVLEGELPSKLLQCAEMYAGCVAGAIQKDDYLKIIGEACFVGVRVDSQKEVIIPDEILLQYLSENELQQFRAQKVGIYSINVYAEKQNSCCCNGESCS